MLSLVITSGHKLVWYHISDDSYCNHFFPKHIQFEKCAFLNLNKLNVKQST